MNVFIETEPFDSALERGLLEAARPLLQFAFDQEMPKSPTGQDPAAYVTQMKLGMAFQAVAMSASQIGMNDGLIADGLLRAVSSFLGETESPAQAVEWFIPRLAALVIELDKAGIHGTRRQGVHGNG